MEIRGLYIQCYLPHTTRGADARAVIEDLGKSKVVAVCVDRSTGLFELIWSRPRIEIISS